MALVYEDLRLSTHLGQPTSITHAFGQTPDAGKVIIVFVGRGNDSGGARDHASAAGYTELAHGDPTLGFTGIGTLLAKVADGTEANVVISSNSPTGAEVADGDAGVSVASAFVNADFGSLVATVSEEDNGSTAWTFAALGGLDGGLHFYSSNQPEDLSAAGYDVFPSGDTQQQHHDTTSIYRVGGIAVAGANTTSSGDPFATGTSAVIATVAFNEATSGPTSTIDLPAENAELEPETNIEFESTITASGEDIDEVEYEIVRSSDGHYLQSSTGTWAAAAAVIGYTPPSPESSPFGFNVSTLTPIDENETYSLRVRASGTVNGFGAWSTTRQFSGWEWDDGTPVTATTEAANSAPTVVTAPSIIGTQLAAGAPFPDVTFTYDDDSGRLGSGSIRLRRESDQMYWNFTTGQWQVGAGTWKYDTNPVANDLYDAPYTYDTATFDDGLGMLRPFVDAGETYRLWYRAEDGTESGVFGSSSGTFTTAAAAVSTPTAVDDSGSTDQDTDLEVYVLTNDLDVDAGASVTIEVQAANGTATVVPCIEETAAAWLRGRLLPTDMDVLTLTDGPGNTYTRTSADASEILAHDGTDWSWSSGEVKNYWQSPTFGGNLGFDSALGDLRAVCRFRWDDTVDIEWLGANSSRLKCRVEAGAFFYQIRATTTTWATGESVRIPYAIPSGAWVWGRMSYTPAGFAFDYSFDDTDDHTAVTWVPLAVATDDPQGNPNVLLESTRLALGSPNTTGASVRQQPVRYLHLEQQGAVFMDFYPDRDISDNSVTAFVSPTNAPWPHNLVSEVRDGSKDQPIRLVERGHIAFGGDTGGILISDYVPPNGVDLTLIAMLRVPYYSQSMDVFRTIVSTHNPASNSRGLEIRYRSGSEVIEAVYRGVVATTAPDMTITTPPGELAVVGLSYNAATGVMHRFQLDASDSAEATTVLATQGALEHEGFAVGGTVGRGGPSKFDIFEAMAIERFVTFEEFQGIAGRLLSGPA